MDILLYLLIAAFIGYVTYALGSLIFLDPSKKKSQSRAPASSGDTVTMKAEEKPKPASPPKAKAEPATAAKKTTPTKPRPAAKSKPKAEKSAAKISNASATDNVTGFINPDTGKEARIPPSYPFAKRWVKEVLVSEGLLDRIYKNTEMDDANSKKVAEALEKLKTIEKYVVRE